MIFHRIICAVEVCGYQRDYRMLANAEGMAKVHSRFHEGHKCVILALDPDIDGDEL